MAKVNGVPYICKESTILRISEIIYTVYFICNKSLQFRGKVCWEITSLIYYFTCLLILCLEGYKRVSEWFFGC